MKFRIKGVRISEGQLYLAGAKNYLAIKIALGYEGRASHVALHSCSSITLLTNHTEDVQSNEVKRYFTNPPP